ncbi:hypothetical protein ABIB53_002732 [Janibacter sp. UYMM211]
MPDRSADRPPFTAHRGRPRVTPEPSAPVIRVELRLPREVAADIYAVADRDDVTISHAVARAWRTAASPERGAEM